MSRELQKKFVNLCPSFCGVVVATLAGVSGSAQQYGNAKRDGCATTMATNASGGITVDALGQLLNGTWVRRLTIGGAPVQTNSYLYFDVAGGRGHGMMIDRVGQGWDRSSVARPASSAASPPLPPATTGVLWAVSMRPVISGHAHGVTLALAGDYRGTGDDYPPAGFRFTENGTFFQAGDVYLTPGGWRAPPQATDTSAGTTATSDAAYRVTVDPGTAGARRPSLTFIGCGDGVVDRYEKLDGAAPRVAGRDVAAAWRAALAAGTFRTVRAR